MINQTYILMVMNLMNLMKKICSKYFLQLQRYVQQTKDLIEEDSSFKMGATLMAAV